MALNVQDRKVATAAPPPLYAPEPVADVALERRRWLPPVVGAVPLLLAIVLSATGAIGRPWLAIVLAAPLPVVALLMRSLVRVDMLRVALWVALMAGATIVGGLLWSPLPVVGLAALQLLLAAWLARAAYRDPRWQARLTLQGLRDNRLELAHEAFGRYLALGRGLDEASWAALRRAELPEARVDDLRARFSGMVNACRYGDLHGLGDEAYVRLFPEAGDQRASAEEG